MDNGFRNYKICKCLVKTDTVENKWFRYDNELILDCIRIDILYVPISIGFQYSLCFQTY